MKKNNALEYLERIANIFPAPLYWLDLNQYYLGVNETLLKTAAAFSFEQVFAGKTPYDLFPFKMAHDIVRHHQEVLRTGKSIMTEESVKILTGKILYLSVAIAPFYDEDNQLIGTIGTSIDMTSQKETEVLKIENTAQKAKIDEQERFKKVVSQIAHDIRSPVAALLMLTKSGLAKNIPENARVIMLDTATRINDIANNFNQYTLKEKSSDKHEKKANNEIKNFMPSIGLQQILAEKKLEYQKKSVEFEINLAPNVLFTFIYVNISDFKRMISNLINNAVDAYEKKDGLVIVHLKKEDQQIIVTIEDNGKGMPTSVIDKITNNIPITSNKKNGHGIGFTQIQETLKAHAGKLSITSQINIGTQVQLTFPEAPPPKWIVNSIEFYADDLVVILDDDSSIHGAWDARLSTDTPNISIKHFEEGEDAIQFINALSPEKKQSVFLLTDYELLNQKYNGLDVIKETQITRSILVTSHFGNEKIQEAAALMNTKILPKLLASDIAIQIKSRGI